MKKSLFQVFEEMNRLDTENNTKTLQVSTSFVESKLSKQGTLITMGVPSDVSIELFNNKAMAVLLIIDKESYNKLKQ